MEFATRMRVIVTGVFGILAGVFGIMTIPLLVLLGANIVDWITGIIASIHEGKGISSARSMHGISKKVMMWLCIAVGAFLDVLIKYACDMFNVSFGYMWIIAPIVAIWIACSELLSILENIIRSGVTPPRFLKPLVEKLMNQVEDKLTEEET